QDQVVDRTLDVFGVGHRGQVHRAFTANAGDLQTVAADRIDVSCTRDERDVDAGLGKARADHAAEATRAQDDDAHRAGQPTLASAMSSMKMPRWPHISPRPV